MERQLPFLSLSTETLCRIKLVVSYDGSDFRGWAAQPEQRTVQGTLTEAVRRITGEQIEIWGASRTDSGAHAFGQTCHFDTRCRIPRERWQPVLNRMLPDDLRVVSADEVDAEFHSRFCAETRIYRYRFVHSEFVPTLLRFGYFCNSFPHHEEMAEVAQHLTGRHDFRAFTEELEPGVLNTVRELKAVNLIHHQLGSEWGTVNVTDLHIEGTAFLRGMMRRMAGLLYDVGRGHRPVEHVQLLLNPERRLELTWPTVLPAKGLTLLKVTYGEPPVDHRLDTHEPRNSNL